MATKTARIDHSTHNHAQSGAAGKTARAKCRADMLKATKAEVKATPAKRTTRATPAAKTVKAAAGKPRTRRKAEAPTEEQVANAVADRPDAPADEVADELAGL